MTVEEGEVLGIVGESGSGKSVSSLAVMGLVAANGTVSANRMSFAGRNLLGLSRRERRAITGRDVAMIFQEPMTSLNPCFTVGFQLIEGMRTHLGGSRRELRRRAAGLLDQVGIPDPETRLRAFPHQLSGGMSQRVMIAMALACNPRLLIADEPTTALDVTVQAQIFDLLRELQRDNGTAILMITHDMGAVAEMADRVMVMYAGRVIEQGSVEQVLHTPRHPYTQGLIECLPELGSSQLDERPELIEIAGVVPSIWELGSGCAFRERCPHAMPRCAHEVPPMIGGGDGHAAACWLLAAAETAVA
ncbi:MAG: ABC transporter ATP-binding protein [Ideonella sp.]|nr:ABC transporter ATP-binding protein [Ideonella sp.]